MFSKILFFTLVSINSFAGYRTAEDLYGKGSVAYAGHRRIVLNLVKDGYYFSAVPWMKDILVTNKKMLDSELETAFDRILTATGVKPFESLPFDLLSYSRSPHIRYILAKKLMKSGKNQDALNELGKIDSDHTMYPFIAHMKGVLHSVLNSNKESETYFRDCIRSSESKISSANSTTRKQLELNRDYCLAGLGRVQFSSKSFKQAELSYLDIQKESLVWPEILFEEAWNSYYLKNYNRTLGKLVSYKAPVFDFIFKPEVEVLKALTYLRMCLYDDAKKTIDEFYADFYKPSKDLRAFINSRGKDYKYYYGLIADHEDGRSAPLPILDSILKSIRKDGAFIEMKTALGFALAEYQELSKKNDSNLKRALMQNIKTVLDEYKTTIGAYVRSGMVTKYAELYSAFEGMSYIKLEMLALRKERLYKAETQVGKKRGDVKYIERNDKQYFWTFNGEFWADELGDYVFALRSEC
jgi:hypothetical protein